MSTAPAQVTVPFAYSIMHRSHPVEKSKLEKEFIDEFLGSFVTLGHSWNHRRIRHDQTQRAPLLDACGCRLRGTRMSCRYWTISPSISIRFLVLAPKGLPCQTWLVLRWTFWTTRSLHCVAWKLFVTGRGVGCCFMAFRCQASCSSVLGEDCDTRHSFGSGLPPQQSAFGNWILGRVIASQCSEDN